MQAAAAAAPPLPLPQTAAAPDVAATAAPGKKNKGGKRKRDADEAPEAGSVASAAGPIAMEDDTGDAGESELAGLIFYFAGKFSGGRPAVMRAVTSSGGAITAAASVATHILVPRNANKTNSIQKVCAEVYVWVGFLPCSHRQVLTSSLWRLHELCVQCTNP